MTAPQPIEYLTQRGRIVTPPPAALFWLSVISSAASGIVGVVIFACYLISHSEWFALFGFLWLYIGGFATFVAAILALVYAGIALSRRFEAPGSIRRSIISIVLPIVDLILAIVCAGIGLSMVTKSTSSVFNPGSRPAAPATIPAMPGPPTTHEVIVTATTVPASPAAIEMLRKLGKRDAGAHDPSTIVRDGDWYYCFLTGQGVPVIRSRDLEKWEGQPHVFARSPDWVATAVPGNRGHFWAPDIVRAKDGRWLLYYSVSTFGKQTSAIALVTNATLDASSPDYAWKDEGIVVKSAPADRFNAIDPAISYDADGKLWMAFGSYWDGIKLIELDIATGLRKGDDTPVPLARNRDVEAAFIYRHGDHYYLFVNWGKCCQGVKSTYEIRIGRADRITGPYYDRDGKDLASNGGTLFLAGDGAMIGPGHAGIVTDAAGHEQLSFHFYDATNDGKPMLGIRPLTWDAQDWPVAGKRD
jgi:arabinan endo-1,5-alpha-L-arabinosidase